MIFLARGLLLGLAVWVAALAGAPAAIASARPPLVIGAAAAYSAGSLICHQRAERSFTIRGRQMPVCARCSGLYASALLGGVLALAAFRRRRIDLGRARWVLAAAALPTAATWLLELAGAAHPSNAARALAALPLGMAAGWTVIRMMAEEQP